MSKTGRGLTFSARAPLGTADVGRAAALGGAAETGRGAAVRFSAAPVSTAGFEGRNVGPAEAGRPAGGAALGVGFF